MNSKIIVQIGDVFVDIINSKSLPSCHDYHDVSESGKD